MCSPCPQAELVRVYAEVELAAHTGGGGGGGVGGNKDVETGSGVTGRGGEEGEGEVWPKRILIERASQEEQNGAKFSFVAPSSEE